MLCSRRGTPWSLPLNQRFEGARKSCLRKQTHRVRRKTHTSSRPSRPAHRIAQAIYRRKSRYAVPARYALCARYAFGSICPFGTRDLVEVQTINGINYNRPLCRTILHCFYKISYTQAIMITIIRTSGFAERRV